MKKKNTHIISVVKFNILTCACTVSQFWFLLNVEKQSANTLMLMLYIVSSTSQQCFPYAHTCFHAVRRVIAIQIRELGYVVVRAISK